MPKELMNLHVLQPMPTVGQDHGAIAIVGAGAIVQAAHLPAYRKAGFDVVGIYDLNVERARDVAAQFDVPRVYGSKSELLDDPSVKFVDVAVPPAAQEQIVPSILRAGRHVLCQKPLALTSQKARELVSQAQDHGVSLAVNVNMRWSPAVRVLRALLESGALGEISFLSIDINFSDNWQSWPWLLEERQLSIRYDTIHVIDALRYLFGEAKSVYVRGSRAPHQQVRGETRVVLVFEYEGFIALIHNSADNWANDTCAHFRLEGSRGMAKGTFGVWYDYPVGAADQLQLCYKEAPGRWVEQELPGKWVPNAWAWTMAELQASVREYREPLNSGRDHLETLRYVESCYTSLEERSVEELSVADPVELRS